MKKQEEFGHLEERRFDMLCQSSFRSNGQTYPVVTGLQSWEITEYGLMEENKLNIDGGISTFRNFQCGEIRK